MELRSEDCDGEAEIDREYGTSCARCCRSGIGDCETAVVSGEEVESRARGRGDACASAPLAGHSGESSAGVSRPCNGAIESGAAVMRTALVIDAEWQRVAWYRAEAGEDPA